MFDVCRSATGLTGGQGDMTPHQNVKNLMLRNDMADAIMKGKFRIYAGKTITLDEGLAILAGKMADEAGPSGGFPEELSIT